MTGDTEVTDARSGRRVKVIDIVEGREDDVHVASLDEERQRIVPRRVVDAFSSGEAMTYTLTTRTGRTTQATGNHPIYTPEGWKYLADLEPDDRVAVPRMVPYESSLRWKKHELVVLGYALSEGNLCHPSGFYVYTKCEDELRDYCQHLRRFDNSATTIDRSKSANSIYAKRADVRHPSAAVTFIERLGLRGLTATTKRVPEEVFRLAPHQLAVLLGRMWTGDGCIDPNGQHVYYATSSRQLAQDVQHLLLRLRLPSTIHEKTFNYRDQQRPGFVVRVSTKELERLPV